MYRTTLLAVAMVLAVGCDKSERPAETPADPAAAQAAKVPDANARKPFVVTITNWEGPTGEEGYILVSLEARDGFHINDKYPQKLTLDAPPDGLRLPLPVMKLKDAEMESDTRLLFSVPAIADKVGEYTIHATLRLGVCNEDTCRFEKAKLSARVVAQ